MPLSLGPAHMLTDPTYSPMVAKWHKVEIKVDWLRLLQNLDLELKLKLEPGGVSAGYPTLALA